MEKERGMRGEARVPLQPLGPRDALFQRIRQELAAPKKGVINPNAAKRRTTYWSKWSVTEIAWLLFLVKKFGKDWPKIETCFGIADCFNARTAKACKLMGNKQLKEMKQEKKNEDGDDESKENHHSKKEVNDDEDKRQGGGESRVPLQQLNK